MMRRYGSGTVVRLLGPWRDEVSSNASYRKLATALRLLILDGRLAPDARLPGERDLAVALGTSRGTVVAAFGELRASGLLASRRGSGSVTSAPRATAGTEDAVVDFTIAALPAGPSIHLAYVEALAALPAHLPTPGFHPLGIPELREALSARFAARGLPTSPEQIMVTNGALPALALVLRLMTGPGDRVLVDHPTYPPALDAIRGASCRPIAVALPASGWDLEAIAAAIAQTAPRFAFLLPDHHNPTGRCMDGATRVALAATAARMRTPIVVDETMAELWYDGPPPAPLASFADAAEVVTIGSTSKTYWGGLRIGWIRASPTLVSALARVRESVDLGAPVLEQLATCRLLAIGDAEIDRRRADLRVRRDALALDARSSLPDWRFPVPDGGLSYWVELPDASATALAARVTAEGLRVTPGPRFGVGGAFERFLRLPFTLERERSRLALWKLADAWRELPRRGLAGDADVV